MASPVFNPIYVTDAASAANAPVNMAAVTSMSAKNFADGTKGVEFRFLGGRRTRWATTGVLATYAGKVATAADAQGTGMFSDVVNTANPSVNLNNVVTTTVGPFVDGTSGIEFIMVDGQAVRWSETAANQATVLTTIATKLAAVASAA